MCEQSSTAEREEAIPPIHYLQTNAIGYSPAWNGTLHSIFGGSPVISMHFPNLHRHPFKGGPEAFYRHYTKELGMKDFHVDSPFPGGPAKAVAPSPPPIPLQETAIS